MLVACGVARNELPSVVSAVCASSSLKRVVLSVQVPDSVPGDVLPEIEDAIGVFRSRPAVQFTLFKHAILDPRKESLYPYRVVRHGLPLPRTSSAQSPARLSSGDMSRVRCMICYQNGLPRNTAIPCAQVLAEVVDLPKSYNKVYGIGPGSALDAEIMTYMKSRGWPERIQACAFAWLPLNVLKVPLLYYAIYTGGVVGRRLDGSYRAEGGGGERASYGRGT
jgi:hypothetical protein